MHPLAVTFGLILWANNEQLYLPRIARKCDLISSAASTGLTAGGINDNLFTGLPYLLPGLLMFIIVLCIDILAIILFFQDTGLPATTVSTGKEKACLSHWTYIESLVQTISRLRRNRDPKIAAVLLQYWVSPVGTHGTGIDWVPGTSEHASLLCSKFSLWSQCRLRHFAWWITLFASICMLPLTQDRLISMWFSCHRIHYRRQEHLVKRWSGES